MICDPCWMDDKRKTKSEFFIEVQDVIKGTCTFICDVPCFYHRKLAMKKIPVCYRHYIQFQSVLPYIKKETIKNS
jgi:hypothetical protein